jgi:hypothetical protein
MKKLFLIGCLFLAGCTSSTEQEVKEWEIYIHRNAPNAKLVQMIDYHHSVVVMKVWGKKRLFMANKAWGDRLVLTELTGDIKDE